MCQTFVESARLVWSKACSTLLRFHDATCCSLQPASGNVTCWNVPLPLQQFHLEVHQIAIAFHFSHPRGHQGNCLGLEG